MFKQPIIILGIFCIALSAKAQAPKLYKDILFNNVTISKDLSYGDVIPNDKKAHLFDLYEAKENHAKARPLIIWMHGGGFKYGSKGARGIKLWSQTFAQRGYVCADINYRLSKKMPLLHFDVLKEACYDAVQDAKAAMEYFKLHHKEYNIDPNKIILGGNSAGGMIAMQTAYSSNAELAKFAGVTDQSSQNKSIVKVAAVINYWGAIFDLNWLKNTSVPIVSALGSNDSLVPPTHKDAPLYGGIDIHNKADALHVPNEIKIFEGYSHELQKHFDPFFEGGKGTKERWLQAGQFAADFLYKELYK